MTPHRSFAIRRTATGLGFFALRSIPTDKRIVEYTGTIITNEEVENIGGKYLFGIDKNRTIDGSSRQNIARYVNHSCRPNAIALVTGNRIWIWSKKFIQAGEEITINYGKEYFKEHIQRKGCKCEKCIARPRP